MDDQTQTTGGSKADEIMRVGQQLIQTNGYDGFSYRDIADLVGIKSASIHYYFPTKADLALAVTRQYRSEFADAVNALSEAELGSLDRLAGFAGVFQRTLEDFDRVCLCGMLASESSSLPDVVRGETEQFFIDQQDWIEATIRAGIDSAEIPATVEPGAFARTFLSALEGAMMMARSMNRPEHLAEVSAQLIGLLEPSADS